MTIHNPMRTLLRTALIPAAILTLGSCDDPAPEAEKNPMQEMGESVGKTLGEADKATDEIMEKADEKAREMLDETGRRLEEAGKDLEEVGRDLQSE